MPALTTACGTIAVKWSVRTITRTAPRAHLICIAAGADACDAAIGVQTDGRIVHCARAAPCLLNTLVGGTPSEPLTLYVFCARILGA